MDTTIRLKVCCPPRVSETFCPLAAHDKPGRLLPKFSLQPEPHTSPLWELTHRPETDTRALQGQYRSEPSLEAGQRAGVRRAINWLTPGSLILSVAIYLYDGLKS